MKKNIKRTILALLISTTLVSSCTFIPNTPTYTVLENNNKKSFTIDMGYKTGKNISVSMDFSTFKTKANANGSAPKTTADLSTAQVYLLSLPTNYTGTDPIGSGTVSGSPITLSSITGSFNVVFNNIQGLPSGKAYYIGIKLKDSIGNELIQLNNGGTAWTGTTATTPNFALSSNSVYVSDINNSVSTTYPLLLTARLSNTTGAKIEIVVSTTNGVRSGSISSKLLGVIRIIAGGGTGGNPNTSGTQNATDVGLFQPRRLSIDNSGNIYIADDGNNLVEKVDTAGKIKVIAGGSSAGTANTSGTQNATDVKLSNPAGVAVDNSGNVYIADTFNNLVEKVDTAGKIKIIAGGSSAGTANTSGTQNATDVKLFQPNVVVVDISGNIYISDTNNNLVEKIDTAGKIKVIAGGSSAGIANTSGTQNATGIKLNAPSGLTVDSSGNFYITDTNNKLVEKVDTAGKIKVIAGGSSSGTANTSGTQNATDVQLSNPFSVSVDNAGSIYIADVSISLIEKVDTAGKIKVIAGGSSSGTANTSGTQNATSIGLSNPFGVAIDGLGNVYIADTGNNLIEKLEQ